MAYLQLPLMELPAVNQPTGATHYELTGPEDGPLVVLLHGATIPMWVWDCQVPALIQAGFRVLRYDMFGKGKSDCLAVNYNRHLFCNQLHQLLDALQIDAPFNLVGFSFGGATAANFTAQYPQRVARLVLIAPVLCFEEGNPMVQAARRPLFGKWLLHYVIMKKMAGRAAQLWSNAADASRYQQLFQEQISRPEFESALRSFLRSDALGDYTDVYRRLDEIHQHACLIWGASDEDIPAAHIRKIRQCMPRVEFHELTGISHGALFQAAETINPLLIEYLRRGRGDS